MSGWLNRRAGHTALLLLCACRPAPVVEVESTSPAAVFSPELAVQRLAGTDALMQRLRSETEAIPEAPGVGDVATVSAEYVLSLEGAPLIQLEGRGQPCVLDDWAVALVSFAGAEAFALVTGDPPRFVALELDTNELRCWPLAEAPAITDTERSETDDPSAALRISRTLDESDPIASVQTELAPHHPGLELLELRYADDDLQVRVHTSAGTPVLTWAQSAECQEHDAALWADLEPDGVGFTIAYDCDDCPDCEHGWSRSYAQIRMWWPDGSPDILVWSHEGRHVSGEDPGDISINNENSFTDRGWRLPAGTLLVEEFYGEYESTEYSDADDDLRCAETETGSSSSEHWTLELDAGPRVSRTIRDSETQSEVERSCD
jgi:hypothetical protein